MTAAVGMAALPTLDKCAGDFCAGFLSLDVLALLFAALRVGFAGGLALALDRLG